MSRQHIALGLALLCSLILIAAFDVSNAAADPTADVVNGNVVPSASTEWNYLAGLLTESSDPFESQFCGGSLIKPTWVLTAAHCYELESDGRFPHFALYGTKVLGAGGSAIPVTGYFRWEDYDPYDNTNGDIMLLHLASAPGGVTPVPLASPGLKINAGTSARVAGWGTISDYPYTYPSDLREATIEVTGDAECEELSGLDTEVSFCAGHVDGASSRVTCFGDSGGPLTVQTSAGPVLAGITSAIVGGCTSEPHQGIYTRVSAFRDWIATRIGRQLISQESLTLGSALVGGAATHGVTYLMSEGPEPVTISSLGTDGADFQIENDECSGKTLAYGASCSVGVAFKPGAAGNRRGALNVASNTEGSISPVTLYGFGLGGSPAPAIGGGQSSKSQIFQYSDFIVKLRRARPKGNRIASRLKIDYASGTTGDGRLVCGGSIRVRARVAGVTTSGTARRPQLVSQRCTSGFDLVMPKRAIGQKVSLSIRVAGTGDVRSRKLKKKLKVR